MSIPKDIEDLFEKFLYEEGPDRVMINQYEATSPRRAREEHGIVSDVIFIRNDGWSLGAPMGLEGPAYKLWRDEWTHYLRRPGITVEPIVSYLQRM